MTRAGSTPPPAAEVAVQHSSSASEERLLRLLQEARQKLESERQRRSEPIAIVGMACRLPGGASSPDELWRLLVNRVDATGDVPSDRWDAEALYDPNPDAPGKAYTRRGAFLSGVDEFDPGVFGISTPEAIGLDPQQRLLLEVTWEALENAGIVTDSTRGSPTGVWVGLCGDDYARRSLTSGNLELIDPYVALGNARSVAAGRIAYVFGLQGPVLQLDTACSSSLVALHLAVRSLRAGECSMALAGGVNLMLSPETTIALCKLNALARDGRCKTFDADADGFGRGEGCGMLVLKRLSDARAAGDRIVAIIRGTAVNHDGCSNGLTAPSGAAQERLIRAALLDADVEPRDVGYVEVDGTGAPLGDAIEVLALSRVYGAEGARSSPLLIGSLKANVGHLEGAAGVVGVIKAALCLSHRRVPPQLHLRSPNPRVPWHELPVKVVTDELDLAPLRNRRLAAVSAFGISGTNTHVVLEESPREAPRADLPERSAELIAVSAKTPGALRAALAKLADQLDEDPGVRVDDIAYSLIATRPLLEQRWAVAAGTRGALIDALRSGANGRSHHGMQSRAVPRVKVAFVFPEQAARWVGMGRGLLEEEPAFRDAMHAVDAAVRHEAGWSVLEELALPEGQSKLASIDVWQPVLFALQLALAELWKAWGIQPDAVVGQGLGEIAAGCVAGALSLRAAVATICRTSAWLGRILDAHAVAQPEASMTQARLPRAALDSRLDPLLAELSSSLRDVTPTGAEVALHSALTGERLSGIELTASRWVDHLREPARFEPGIAALIENGFTHFVEISPHPSLISAINQVRQRLDAPGVATGSLQRGRPERLALLEALGALYVHGHPLDARSSFGDGVRRVSLPNYPWQRQRYWLDPPVATPAARAVSHASLGRRSSSPLAEAVFEAAPSLRELPWLGDHRIHCKAVLPAAALMEMLRRVGRAQRAGAPCEVSDLVIEAPFVVDDAEGRMLQVVLTDGGTRAAVYGRLAGSELTDGWTRHASAKLGAAGDAGAERLDVPALRARCTRSLDVESVYLDCAAAGLDFGPALRALRSLSAGSREAIVEVALPSAAGADRDVGWGAGDAEDGESLLGPTALLASALLAPSLVLELEGGPWLPASIRRYVLHRPTAKALVVHLQAVSGASGEAARVDATLADPSGYVVGRVAGVQLRRVPASPEPVPVVEASADAIYRVESHEMPLLGEPPLSSASPTPSHVALCECLNPSPTPRARLFGFHDAGGSPSLFQHFLRLARENVEIHTVSNARKTGARGPLDEGAAQRYLDEAVRYIRSRSELPYVLFGQSLGGLLAWRVLKALQREGVRLPRLLVLSAAATPPALERARSPEGMSELFERLIGDRWKGLKSLRGDFNADFALWTSLPSADQEPIDVAILAFAGRDDIVAGTGAMSLWRSMTTAGFSSSELPGGHFYIYDGAARAAMLETLREKLREL